MEDRVAKEVEELYQELSDAISAIRGTVPEDEMLRFKLALKRVAEEELDISIDYIDEDPSESGDGDED